MGRESLIKKLLRKRLKKRIVILSGGYKMEEMFQWVYNAPVHEWKRRLFCLGFGGVQTAEKLFRFLYQERDNAITG